MKGYTHITAEKRAYIAPWWELLLARALGKRSVAHHGTTRIVGYRWRGRSYITEFRSEGQRPESLG